MKTAFSPGPWTRCGTVSLEDGAVKVTYSDTVGITYTVFILNARDFIRNRDAVPVPVFSRGDTGAYTKIGYAHRSPSGRAWIISTASSNGDLTIQWSVLQKVIHGATKTAPVSRMNAPLL